MSTTLLCPSEKQGVAAAVAQQLQLEAVCKSEWARCCCTLKEKSWLHRRAHTANQSHLDTFSSSGSCHLPKRGGNLPLHFLTRYALCLTIDFLPSNPHPISSNNLIPHWQVPVSHPSPCRQDPPYQPLEVVAARARQPWPQHSPHGPTSHQQSQTPGGTQTDTHTLRRILSLACQAVLLA